MVRFDLVKAVLLQVQGTDLMFVPGDPWFYWYLGLVSNGPEPSGDQGRDADSMTRHADRC